MEVEVNIVIISVVLNGRDAHIKNFFSNKTWCISPVIDYLLYIQLIKLMNSCL